MASKKPKNTPSTEGLETDVRVLYPWALPFRSVRGAEASLAASLGVKTTQAVAQRLSSPASIDERLAKLSWASLAMLDWIANLGGALYDGELVDLGHEVGLNPGQVLAALRECCDRALLIPTEASDPFEHATLIRYSVPAESAVHLGARVRGVSLPEPPLALEAPDAAALDTAEAMAARDRLALLTVPAHEPIKVNASGALARVPLKRIAQKLNQDIDALERAFVAAYHVGSLGSDEHHLLKPMVAELRSSPTPLDRPKDREVVARVGDAWQSAEGLALALAYERSIRRPPQFYYAPSLMQGLAELQAARKWVGEVQGLQRITHEGKVFVRKGAVGRPLSEAFGDGHVTPSLEVMLGPACDPVLALEVGLFCELVRVDKVLTFKLTPASVTTGCALGLDVPHMLAMLGKVSRHPLAANVASLVEDFARGARFVSIETLQVLRTSNAEAADRLAKDLGQSVKGRPTPTMLLVDIKQGNLSARALKLGISTMGETTSLRSSASSPSHFGAPKAPAFAPDETLRATFLRERSVAPPEMVAPRSSPATRLREMARADLAPRVRSYLQGVAELWDGFEDEFLAWSRGLSVHDGLEVQEFAGEVPLAFVYVLARPPKDRTAMLRECKDLLALLTRGKNRSVKVSPEGDAALRLLEDPVVKRFHATTVDQALRSLGDSNGMAAPAPDNVVPLFGGAASGGGRPLPADLGAESTAAIRAKLERAAGKGDIFWLRVRSKASGEQVIRCMIDNVIARGREATVLVTDLDERTGRALPLATIVAVVPAG